MTCCHSTPIKYFPRRQETLRLWTLIPCYKCIFSYRANMTNWKGSKCFLNHVQHPRFTALSRGCKQELNIWLDSCWTLRPPLLSGFYSHVKRHTFLKNPYRKKIMLWCYCIQIGMTIRNSFQCDITWFTWQRAELRNTSTGRVDWKTGRQILILQYTCSIIYVKYKTLQLHLLLEKVPKR